MNLRLLQISDSALPIGGFTHSWGLETAIDRRQARDAATLESWCRIWLRHSYAPMEGVIAACCCRAAAANDWQTIHRANQILSASISPPSIRAASREMGEQLLNLASTWEWSGRRVSEFERHTPNGQNWRVWNHAVIFGMMGSNAGASTVETLKCFLHQGVVGVVNAGVRAIPVGHTHGQQILAYLHDEIEELAGLHARAELESAGSGSPYYEIICHEQTQLYSRLFRS